MKIGENMTVNDLIKKLNELPEEQKKLDLYQYDHRLLEYYQLDDADLPLKKISISKVKKGYIFYSIDGIQLFNT
jgi:hypothetical protein